MHRKARPWAICRILKELAHVEPIRAQSVSNTVLDTAVTLAERSLAARDEKLQITLQVLGRAVQHHEQMAAALRSDAKLRARVDALLDAAAAEGAVYRSPLDMAQMTFAQGDLGLCCERFWRELERSEGAGVDDRGVRQLLRCRVKLTVEDGAPPPSAALLQVLEHQALRHAGTMTREQARSCLEAFEKIEHTPHQAVRDALLTAVERGQGSKEK